MEGEPRAKKAGQVGDFCPVRDSGGLDLGCSDGSHEKGSDSGYILNWSQRNWHIDYM